MTSARLFILGEERDLLWTNMNYKRQVDAFGVPSTYIEGGLITLSFVSQENDYALWHNLLKGVHQETDRMEKGEIYFYGSGDQDIPIRKYKFSDAYIVFFSETFDAFGSGSLQTVLTLSPAIQNYGLTKDFVKYWQVSWIKPTEPVYYRPAQEEEDRIIYINGHFYNKDGTFEGKVNETDYEGTINDVYVCDGKSTQKDKNGNDFVTYNNTKLLKENDVNVTHLDFQKICNIVKHEGLSTDQNEYLYIAHANYNEGKYKNTNMLARLMTTYSSVELEDKKRPLSDDAKDNISQYSRKGVIDALLREINISTDLTDGARFWDGVDFLAWGIEIELKADSNTKNGHNKFGEYDYVKIEKKLYGRFVLNVQEKYPNGVSYKSSHDIENDKGDHTHKESKKGNKAIYKIPAADFLDETYWTTGDFFYKNKNKRASGLVATKVAGYSIFWKEIKN
ncbi:type VI secretion system tube protein TssD [Flavobacterium araucananum]|nr:type VI secretion system tube protein TssD [Flavobacterium araucananum]